MIAEALADYAKATARHFLGRENTVGASEVGQCARKIYLAKNVGDPVYGAACDEDYADPWGAALRGRLFEDHFWVPALRARFGAQLLYAGDQQQTLVFGFLSATPDGLLIDQPHDVLASLGIAGIGGDGSIVVECKTIDPRVKLDAPKPEHAFQAQVQIGLFRKLTRCHQPEVAVISYVNASFFDDVTEFAVRFDPAVFENAKRRAAAIATARSTDQLKPEGWIAGGRECEFCPFTKACGVIRHTVPTQTIAETPDPQFVAEIADLAREAKQRRAAVELTTAALREVEHEIKERLRAKGVHRVETGDVSVAWSAVKGRPSYDMPGIREAAAKAGIDLAEYETVGSPTDRLVIRATGHPARLPDLQT
jgi:hypothetical protein